MTEKKPWKLFGKLNVIDLLILLIVIAAVAVLGSRLVKSKTTVVRTAATQKTIVTFYGFDDVSTFVMDAMQVGDPVELYPNDTRVGTLLSFSREPAYELVTDPATGETARQEILDHCFLTFTCECNGAMTREGLTIEDTTFVVGGNYYLNVGPTRAGYRLMSMEPAE